MYRELPFSQTAQAQDALVKCVMWDGPGKGDGPVCWGSGSQDLDGSWFRGTKLMGGVDRVATIQHVVQR